VSDTVKLKALDSFQHCPLGMVPAKARFEASRKMADELIVAGLAVEVLPKLPAAKAKKSNAAID